MIPQFDADVLEGKVEFKHRHLFDKYIEMLPNGPIQIVVKTNKEKDFISEKQRKYYHGVIVKMISELTGETRQRTHLFLRAMFLSEKISIGSTWQSIPLSTTRLKTDEAETYFSEIREWASDKIPLLIPLPNEVDLDSVSGEW